MVDIAKKKIPMPITELLLYFSYCATYWFSSRGALVYYAYDTNIPGWLTNDAFAFFIGGLVPFAIYSLITSLIFKSLPMATRGGDIHSLRYGLNLTVITANVLLFALKFMYIAMPLAAPVIDKMIDPIVTVLLVAGYMAYAFRMNYVDKARFRIVLTQVSGTFIIIYGLLAVVNMIIAVA